MSISNTFKDLAGGGLDDFAPRPRAASASAEAPPTTSQLERLAAQQGFEIDNHPVVRKALRSGRVASRDKAQPMTLRLRIGDWNRFSAFCERNGYTVAEGFERLVNAVETL